MKIDRLKADLEKAQQKAAEWQAKVKDIERQITEQENFAIIQAVRDIAVSPDELPAVLERIRSMKGLAENSMVKEAAEKNEE